jgi:hypothetical protein
LFIERGVKAIPRNSTEIVLDIDATDDPLHGSQEGAYFKGFYREYCYSGPGRLWISLDAPCGQIN